ncbi:MAG: 2-oxo acid dehydrogenase subunit E2 [Chloroflexi bacterium]|nr:2-oxo acid dehydrogenase subunit E2 [Chloroflexota bacterium]
MISEVVMPQMGADMEEGTVVRWLKQVGDAVERGEIIAEIETDKANVEIEAFDSGTFRTTLASEGDTVAVGTVIALIADTDDDISQYQPAATITNGAQAAATTAVPAPTARPPNEDTRPQSEDTRPAKQQPERVRASPVARKLAQENSIDLAQLTGTGPDGRIVRRDIEAAISSPAQTPAPSPTTTGQSKMRQTIARRMSQSKREAPHYYITVEIDMTDAERLRRQLNEAAEDYPRVSVNDLIVKACAGALARQPIFNTSLVEGEIQAHEQINVCIAIALDDGLIAPAILDCANKNLGQIAEASRSLAERAKSGSLKPEEYTGGTFTVSNLGMFNVESLVAIIQPPQTAILGVGAVRAMPIVRDGKIEPAEMMKVALSADHRVTDGAQGAQLLNEIRRLLENPAALLV